MDSCQYEVITHDTGYKKGRKETIVSLLKQILIASSCWTQFFMAGLCVGAPTVFIPQIRKEANSTVIINDELGSWLYSTNSFAMYPWIFLLPLLTKRWGRKLLQLASAICSMLIFIILYFSKNPYHILISEVLQGFLYAGNMIITILVITEYSSIKYRGMFLTIKSASFFWGIWVANAVGTFFYWKNIAILGFICSLHTFSFSFCPESPYWLVSKGKIDECKASYRWIHGSDENSEKKLQKIIESYSDKKEHISFTEMLKSKEFYKPLAICVLAIIQYNFTGKVVCSLYILDIFKNITENEATAYSAMLILDGVTVFGMYFGSFLSKILKRRTLYMSSSFAGVFFLFVISIYLYLVRFSVISANNYLTITLLIIYSLSISCGPMILCSSIYGEIIPVKFQTTCYMITGLTIAVFLSLLLKLTPTIFATFGIHGTFLFYSIACGLCTVYLYVYMPETKNKTHEEIALFFRGEENKIEEHKSLR